MLKQGLISVDHLDLDMIMPTDPDALLDWCYSAIGWAGMDRGLRLS